MTLEKQSSDLGKTGYSVRSLLLSPISYSSLLSSQPFLSLFFVILFFLLVTLVYDVWTKLKKGNHRRGGVACAGEMSMHGG